MIKILKYAFRITHIDNIPYIAQCGFVKDDSSIQYDHYVNIGDRKIIEHRRKMVVKGYNLGDYIPFYLGPRSPMLYVIQNGYNGVQRIAPENIVYCVVRIDDLINNNIECIFTDGHALSYLTSFYTKDDLPRISSIVKFDDVYSLRWNTEDDIDLKRRKEAELLLKDDLPPHFIKGYVVFDEGARQVLLNMGIDDKLIAVVPGYYF